MFIFNIAVDAIFLILIAGEASFTGSGGTRYYIGDNTTYGAGLYIIYFALAVAATAGIQLYRAKYDLVPIFIYTIASFFISQYGSFINLDYLEANRTSLGWWGTLNNITTLGNTPWDPPTAEAVHWAIVEAVVVVLVCIDVTHQLRNFSYPLER